MGERGNLRGLRRRVLFALLAHPPAIERWDRDLAFLCNDTADRTAIRAPAIVGAAVPGIHETAALGALADQLRGASGPHNAAGPTAKAEFARHGYLCLLR